LAGRERWSRDLFRKISEVKSIEMVNIELEDCMQHNI
jgi:hypothetical protein